MPRREHDMWNLPAASMFATEDRNRVALWGWQMRRRLTAAARHRGLFHLWFHPHNVVRGGQEYLDVLEGVLERAASLRSRGRLQTLTMGDLARQLDERPTQAA